MVPKIVVGLPAYNEEQSLPPLLEKIVSIRRNLGLDIDVLIVNDGSTDRTKMCLEKYLRKWAFMQVINHPVNMGLGAAVIDNTLNIHCLERYKDKRHFKLQIMPFLFYKEAQKSLE